MNFNNNLTINTNNKNEYNCNRYLLIYCKKYPTDKISKNRFIIEYHEFTYRLEQNISTVILDLYKIDLDLF